MVLCSINNDAVFHKGNVFATCLKLACCCLQRCTISAKTRSVISSWTTIAPYILFEDDCGLCAGVLVYTNTSHVVLGTIYCAALAHPTEHRRPHGNNVLHHVLLLHVSRAVQRSCKKSQRKITLEGHSTGVCWKATLNTTY
jgi:hypothetical protein